MSPATTFATKKKTPPVSDEDEADEEDETAEDDELESSSSSSKTKSSPKKKKSDEKLNVDVEDDEEKQAEEEEEEEDADDKDDDEEENMDVEIDEEFTSEPIRVEMTKTAVMKQITMTTPMPIAERAELHLKQGKYFLAEIDFLSVDKPERVVMMYLEAGLMRDMLRVIKENQAAMKDEIHLKAAEALRKNRMLQDAELQYVMGREAGKAINMYLGAGEYEQAYRVAAENGDYDDEKRVLEVWSEELIRTQGITGAMGVINDKAGADSAVDLAIAHACIKEAIAFARRYCPNRVGSIVKNHAAELAKKGKFGEAEALLITNGKAGTAVDMYIEYQMYDQAQNIALTEIPSKLGDIEAARVGKAYLGAISPQEFLRATANFQGRPNGGENNGSSNGGNHQHGKRGKKISIMSKQEAEGAVRTCLEKISHETVEEAALMDLCDGAVSIAQQHLPDKLALVLHTCCGKLGETKLYSKAVELYEDSGYDREAFEVCLEGDMGEKANEIMKRFPAIIQMQLQAEMRAKGINVSNEAAATTATNNNTNDVNNTNNNINGANLASSVYSVQGLYFPEPPKRRGFRQRFLRLRLMVPLLVAGFIAFFFAKSGDHLNQVDRYPWAPTLAITESVCLICIGCCCWLLSERRSYLKQLFYSTYLTQVSFLLFAAAYTLEFINFVSAADRPYTLDKTTLGGVFYTLISFGFWVFASGLQKARSNVSLGGLAVATPIVYFCISGQAGHLLAIVMVIPISALVTLRAYKTLHDLRLGLMTVFCLLTHVGLSVVAVSQQNFVWIILRSGLGIPLGLLIFGVLAWTVPQRADFGDTDDYVDGGDFKNIATMQQQQQQYPLDDHMTTMTNGNSPKSRMIAVPSNDDSNFMPGFLTGSDQQPDEISQFNAAQSPNLQQKKRLSSIPETVESASSREDVIGKRVSTRFVGDDDDDDDDEDDIEALKKTIDDLLGGNGDTQVTITNHARRRPPPVAIPS